MEQYLLIVMRGIRGRRLDRGQMRAFILSSALILSSLFDVSESTAVAPLVGILSLPTTGNSSYGSFIEGAYVQWLESSGCRTVPLLYDSSAEYLTTLVSSLDAVLFTG